MPGKRAPLEQRFWSRVDVRGEHECWEWRGERDRNNYGQVRLADRRRVGASRISYESVCGTIPCGLVVMHKCDNPPCVNPNHLRLGTKAENSADMAAKGRSTKGEKNAHAKLTDDQAQEIRRIGFSASCREMAQRFGVSPMTISRARSGQTYERHF